MNAIAVDGNGNPFINLGDATIEKLDPANGNSIASGTGGGDLQNVGDHNIVVDAGNIVIAQWGNRITRYDNDLVEQWSTPLVKPLGSAESFMISVDAIGNIWATFYAIFGTVTLDGTDYTDFPKGYVYNLDGTTGAVLECVSPGAYKIKEVIRSDDGALYVNGDFAFNASNIVKYDALLTALWSVPTFGVKDMAMIGPDCFVLGGVHDGSITLEGTTYDRPNNSGSDNAMASYLCGGAIGLDERRDGPSFAVYPNPADMNITVEGTAMGAVRVLNAMGAEVMRVNAPAARRTLDISGLNNGTYLLLDAQDRSARFNVQR